MSDRLFALDHRWARAAMMGVAATLLFSAPISSDLRVPSISRANSGANQSDGLPASLKAAIGATLGEAFLTTEGRPGLDALVLTEEARLLASDGQAGDAFGTVALDGDTALVGASSDDTAAGVNAGSVYVFVRHG